MQESIRAMREKHIEICYILRTFLIAKGSDQPELILDGYGG